MTNSKEAIPLDLAQDLLSLDLGADEKIAILENTWTDNRLAYEHFLTHNLLGWHQDIATRAIRNWAVTSDHLLWFRLVNLCRSPLAPQRVRYTVLDHGFVAGGRFLVEAFCDIEGLDDFSPAFHGLFLHRCVQWNVSHPSARAIAERIFGDVSSHFHPDDKALASAVAYLARFEPTVIRNVLSAAAMAEPWVELCRSLVISIDMEGKHLEKLKKFAAKPPKTRPMDRLKAMWPPMWQRHSLSSDLITTALKIYCEHVRKCNKPRFEFWNFFGGCSEEALIEGALGLENPADFALALRGLGDLLPPTHSEGMVGRAKELMSAGDEEFIQELPTTLKVAAGDTSLLGAKDSDVKAWQTEASATLAAKGSAVPLATIASRAGASEDPARSAFFDLAFRGIDNGAPAGDGFWSQLYKAWQTPDDSTLGEVAQIARQQTGIFRLAYLKTLGRYEGQDQAALKSLDYVRSNEEDDLRAIIHALAGINTSRARQELVATLTRPNVSQPLQLEICALLADQDTSNLQAELRSALSDLSTDSNDSEGLAEVREAISGLLDPTQNDTSRSERGPSAGIGISDKELDEQLAKKIPTYTKLSSEVKRALRTAQFFHVQVSANDAPESIDLSPVIDMQYKALELLFRESFEHHASQLIHQGVLQRRLDVIGYARPVPRAMDEFETFISKLPIVREIPFFSKFKLRKMLRAICQFRPGKRFTLDGLKAFALFFLCFGRSQCRYGLERLIPLGFKDDSELYEFARNCHELQDSRNRAAHEGFHPDASNNIDGIWQKTAEIVQVLQVVRAHMDANFGKEHAPVNRSNPIVTKKVS